MRLLLAFVLATGCTTATSDRPAAVLPLQTLHLYETGVGYFERAGNIRDTATLPVPAGHLDDALKTLAVIDASGDTRVHGFEFSSSLSNGLARALAGLPATDGPVAHHHLLESLEGAAVRVQTNDDAFGGRLIEVLTQVGYAENEDGEQIETEKEVTLLLLSDRGDIRRIAGDELVAIQPTDPVLRARLDSALDALSPRAAQTQRQVRLLASSAGPVKLGYVAETPVWRTTYRIILAADGKSAQIQSWALVHNDTDEDWSGVQLHLVNGRPDSFLFPLAAPRYAWREMVTPEDELSTVPQLIDETVDQLWGDFAEEGSYAVGLGAAGRLGGGGMSYGSARGVAGIGTTGRIGSLESSVLEVGDLAAIDEAEGTEEGALFTFALAEPIDLRAHGSALVPYVDQTVKVEQVTWMLDGGELARSAVLFTNETPYTLPAGPVSVLQGTGFAGESALERIKPGQRTLVSYGVDLDVHLELKDSRASETLKRLTFGSDLLVVHFVRHTSRDYEIENRGGQERLVYVPLGVVNNATVEGADSIDRNPADDAIVAAFRLPGTTTRTPTLEIDEGLSRNYNLQTITSALLSSYADTASIESTDRDVVRRAIPVARGLEAVRTRGQKLEEARTTLEREQKRLEGYLKSLGGEGSSEGGAAALVRRILANEDQRKTLDARVETFQKELEAATHDLREALMPLVREGRTSKPQHGQPVEQ